MKIRQLHFKTFFEHSLHVNFYNKIFNFITIAQRYINIYSFTLVRVEVHLSLRGPAVN